MTIKARPLMPSERIDDEFYYGYRTIITYDEEGKEIYSYMPLSLDDFLDPQEGDLFMQGSLHNKDTDTLKSIFRYIHQDNPNMAVFSDLKILWGVEGLSQPAPDVTLVPNVENPDKPRPVFDVIGEETSPIFVLEVVSPRYRQPDRDRKVSLYEQAGVQEYFIIDSWLQGEQVSYEVLGYRLQEGIYTQIQPSEKGWVFSQINNVWIGVNETKDAFFVIDAKTNQRVLPAESRAEAETARAEAETARAEAEAVARQQAEAKIAELEIQLRELEARYQTKSDTQTDQED